MPKPSFEIGKHRLTTFDHPDFASLRLKNPVRLDRTRAYVEHAGHGFTIPLVYRGRPLRPRLSDGASDYLRPHAGYTDVVTGDHHLVALLQDPVRRNHVLGFRAENRQGAVGRYNLFSIAPSGEEQRVASAQVDRLSDGDLWLHSLLVFPHVSRRLRSERPEIRALLRERPQGPDEVNRQYAAVQEKYVDAFGFGAVTPPAGRTYGYRKHNLSGLLSRVIDEVAVQSGHRYILADLNPVTTGKHAERFGWTVLHRDPGVVKVQKDLRQLALEKGWNWGRSSR